MNPKQVLGKLGESEAKKFLKNKGLKVLFENYRCRLGEIDLICKEKNELVFVEVKTRSSSLFGEGTEAITLKKRRKLMNLALLFIKNNQLNDPPFRFDVVSISLEEPHNINHIPNAFS